MASATSTWQPTSHLATCAPFPNCHLLAPASVGWSAPQRSSPLVELRKKVREHDWERSFEDGETQICMRAEWSANEDRCSLLQCLATGNGARRVLEIGSFCGVGALALAEAIPAEGEVYALELDPFVVAFGRLAQLRSTSGQKIWNIKGPADASLQELVEATKAGHSQPFDMVVVDADKESMRHYFEMLWSTPGFLSERAVVCVDMTPFKGQAPTRYARFGFPYRWEVGSGQKEIDALREEVRDSEEFVGHELGQFLIVQRKH